MQKTWAYNESGGADSKPVVANLPGLDPFVILPDGTRLSCKTLQGARAVASIISLFVIKQEEPEK